MARHFAGPAALVAIVACVGLLGAAAPVTRAPAVQAVMDCRKIADSAQRLACYDDAVAKMTAAESSGDLVTIDKQQRRAARRQAFGVPLPSLAFLDRGEKVEDANRIVATITSSSEDAFGKWTIVLDDGAVWRQIDDNTLDHAPHEGSKAEIRRASLGSFFVKIDGQPSLRMHRDR